MSTGKTGPTSKNRVGGVLRGPGDLLLGLKVATGFRPLLPNLADLLIFSREARSLDFYLKEPDFQMLANKIGLWVRCGLGTATVQPLPGRVSWENLSSGNWLLSPPRARDALGAQVLGAPA